MNSIDMKSHDTMRAIGVALSIIALCLLCLPKTAHAELSNDTITLVALYCEGVDDTGIVRVLADSGFQMIDIVPASIMNCRIIRGTLLNVDAGTDTFYGSIIELCRILKVRNCVKFAHPLYSLEECKESLLCNSPNYYQRQISLLFYGDIAKDSLRATIETGQLNERQAFETVMNYALLCDEEDSRIIIDFLQNNSDNYLNKITGINAMGIVRGTSQYNILKNIYDSTTDDGLKQTLLFALGNVRQMNNDGFFKDIIDSEAVAMQLRLSAGIILAKREETVPLQLARNIVTNPGNYSLDELQYAISILGMVGDKSDSTTLNALETGRNVELIRAKQNAEVIIYLRSLDNEEKRELYEDILRTGSVDEKDNEVLCWIVKDIVYNHYQPIADLLKQAAESNEYWLSASVDGLESSVYYSNKYIMHLLGAVNEKENRNE